MKKKFKKIKLMLLIFTSIFLSPFLNSRYINFTNNALIDEGIKPFQAAALTDEFTSIFTWKSSTNKTYEESYESLNFDSLVGNLTDFDPENSTSYTNLDAININYQPSNASWNHTRDFATDALLPSTNLALILDEPGEMGIPYDTTVFFARKQSVYNIIAYWEHEINFLSYLDSNLYLFNQSQFHDFENYIRPWRTGAFGIGTLTNFNSSHTPDDWIYGYFNKTQNLLLLPEILTHTINFTVGFNQTGWYYLVLWGENDNGNDKPIVATGGELLSEGPTIDDITANDLMDIYRPSLGKIAGTITDPLKVYERVIQGVDETYGDSFALIYIYEFPTRLTKNGLTTVDYDWMPYIVYINNNTVGEFPNRIAYYYDDNWYDDKDRHLQIIDPSFSSGNGFYQYTINITAEFAPFMNETVNMDANVSTTPVSMENRIGSAIRLSITSNSHGCEIKPPHYVTGATYSWIEIPKFPLNDSTLRKLYNDTIIEFLENGWESWALLGGKYFPQKTPFVLYFKSLFTAPYLISGLENILLVKPEAKSWFENLIPTNTYFNSRLDIEVNTTIDIPVNYTITSPENEPAVGQSSDFTLALGAMGNPNITIDYTVNYSMNFSMMLFSGSYGINKSDTIHFSIPLMEIDILLGIFGIDDGLSGLASRKIQETIDEALEKSKVDEYISIEDFSLGNHVVGNIVSCNITIHLWPIIKYLGEKYLPPPDKYYFEVAKIIIDKIILNETTGLDLIISPQLQGVLTGVIVGDGLDFSNGGQFEFNATQQSVIFQADRTQDFSTTSIHLQSLLYKLNFHVDWAFEINFNKFLHNYLDFEDLHWELGTYPSIDFAPQSMVDSEFVYLNWNEWTPPSAPSPPTLTITTSSPTTSYDISLTWTTSTGADNYTLYRHTSQITSSNLNSATEVKTIPGTSTTDTVSGVGRWYYAIVATNEVGSSDPSNSPYIDVQDEPTDVPGGGIPGYQLIFLGLFSLIGIILIIHKKSAR